MRKLHQSDASFDEIAKGKARRRDELIKAVREADPAVLASAAEHLREAMRNKDPSQRRQRLAPPLFHRNES